MRWIPGSMTTTLPPLAAAVLLVGCALPPPAAAPDSFVSSAFRRPAPPALLVLLPATGAEDLREGRSMMTDQMHRQLVGLGYRVVALDPAIYDTVWAQEAQAVGGLFDPVSGALKAEAYVRALSALGRRTCREVGCAGVIQQRLVFRPAELGGLKAAWDGQQRVVPVAGTGGTDNAFTGSTQAVSVELTAILSDGLVAFRSFGGASLPFRSNLSTRRNEVRVDLFADDAEIADGVRIALAPLAAQAIPR